MREALAIDVGGTKIYSAIINEKGEIISEIEKHHTPKTFAEIKSLFEDIIKRHEDKVEIIAFATCGAVNNTNDGILGSTGNIAKEYPSMDFKALSKKCSSLGRTHYRRFKGNAVFYNAYTRNRGRRRNYLKQ